jgi:hypothetical protein
MKDEALCVQKPRLLSLPIPEAPIDLCSSIEALVEQAYGVASENGNLTELLDIEARIKDQVTKAFRLSTAEVALIERTLPPRDPLAVLEQRLRKS